MGEVAIQVLAGETFAETHGGCIVVKPRTETIMNYLCILSIVPSQLGLP